MPLREPRQSRLSWTSQKHHNGSKAARHEGSNPKNGYEATAGPNEALSSFKKWHKTLVPTLIYSCGRLHIALRGVSVNELHTHTHTVCVFPKLAIPDLCGAQARNYPNSAVFYSMTVEGGSRSHPWSARCIIELKMENMQLEASRIIFNAFLFDNNIIWWIYIRLR